MNEKEIWLSNLVSNCQPFEGDTDEYNLIGILLDQIDQLKSNGNNSTYDLAAAFDLLVAAAYYGSVAHTGWIYCPESILGSAIFYPYTNVCPACAVKNQFHFHKANKPRSGVIGAHTSRLLALFIQEALARKKSSVKILKGSEPVDVIFIDNTTKPITVMFAEIKAAPLLTLPLILDSQTFIIETDTGIQDAPHRETDNSRLFDTELKVYLPLFNKNKDAWEEKTYSVGGKMKDCDRAEYNATFLER